MVLYVPGGRGAGWASTHNDFALTPSSTSPGNKVTVTSGTSSAYGSTTTLLSALAFEAAYLIIEWDGTAGSAVDTRMLMDVRIDRAGGTSWETAALVPDILCGFAINVNSQQNSLHLPLRVPAGASLGAQVKWNGAAARSVRVGITAFARDSLAPWQKVGQRAVAVGINGAGFTGTAVSATSSPWTNVGAPLESDTFGMTLLCGLDNNPDYALQAITAQIGFGSNPIWHPSINSAVTTLEQMYPQHRSINCGRVVPAGTQMQVRHKGSIGNTYGFAIYGVV